MKKSISLCIALFACILTYSQDTFKKGYFIDNANQKIDCMIKDLDWDNSPTSFKFKKDSLSEVHSKDIRYAKEFGIEGGRKFVRFNVKIDKSSNITDNLNYNKKPNFIEETLFLEPIIEGKATLFFYKNKNLRRYFYIIENRTIEQLVHKYYLDKNNNDIERGENNLFRQQLWANLRAPNSKFKDFKNLSYKRKSLSKIFITYNRFYGNSNQVSKTEFEHKKPLNISIKAGIRNNSLQITHSNNVYKPGEFDSQLNASLGVELEYYMPFNNNKYSLFVRPNYQKFSDTSEIIYLQTVSETRSTSLRIDYQSIEMPIGIRYNHFINSESKFYIDASLIIDIPLTKNIKTDRPDIVNLEISPGNNLQFGFGFQHKKYSIEANYSLERDIFARNLFWSGKYNGVSLLLGYTIF